jgi:hypothetical protein|tara:strand:- start:106 stop:390 length:285 start_codon:yes stop_codon:yes gene_type:complete
MDYIVYTITRDAQQGVLQNARQANFMTNGKEDVFHPIRHRQEFRQVHQADGVEMEFVKQEKTPAGVRVIAVDMVIAKITLQKILVTIKKDVCGL